MNNLHISETFIETLQPFPASVSASHCVGAFTDTKYRSAFNLTKSWIFLDQLPKRLSGSNKCMFLCIYFPKWPICISGESGQVLRVEESTLSLHFQRIRNRGFTSGLAVFLPWNIMATIWVHLIFPTDFCTLIQNTRNPSQTSAWERGHEGY